MIGISVAANKEWNCVREYFKDTATGEKKPEDGTSEYLVLLKKKG